MRLVLYVFINPKGASIQAWGPVTVSYELVPESETSTTFTHEISPWFYRKPPTLIVRLPVHPSPAERLRAPQTRLVLDNWREYQLRDGSHPLM